MPKHGLIFNVTQYPYLSRPLGGHRIAHFLRENSWDVEVVDWANWWTLEQLKEFFRSRYSSQTAFVGFGHLFSIWSDRMESFARWIKDHYPNVTIISGSGVNPMFESQNIDWYVQGFGEHAILHLLRYCAANGPRPKFRLFGQKKVINAIDDYPAFPMRSLMVRYENRDHVQSHEWLTVELSRGCKFQCAFCQFPVLGVKEDTSRDSSDFELQLRDAYDRFGITSYMISDETANDRLEKISKFADVVQRLPFVPWFSAYIRLDLLAADSAQKPELSRMNLRGHFYGIESMNTKSAKSIGKGMNSERIKRALIDTKEFFQSNGGMYRGHVGLIAGLPHETEQTIHDTAQWLVDNWQGQSFGIGALTIPAQKSLAKKSDIAQDIMGYGYWEMDAQDLAQVDMSAHDFVRKIQKKGEYQEMGEEIFWQNQNMNLLDARKIVGDIYAIKLKHDFRPGPLMINYNLKQTKNISELLQLTFDQYDNLLADDINHYVSKKLSG